MQNFDWNFYVSFYDDLSILKTKKDAYNHWVKYGVHENRICSKELLNKIIPQSFNWTSYVNKYPDLSNIKNKEDAYIHWIKYGSREKRTYDTNNNNILNILYCVDITCKLDHNTGIERVVRLLGHYLHKNKDINLFLIKYDKIKNCFDILNESELKCMERYNCIPYDNKKFDLNLPHKILFIPEIPYHVLSNILELAKNNNIPVASIFYDDVMYKLSHYWKKDEVSIKSLISKYIYKLLDSDIIFPISKYSKDRLLYHYSKSNKNLATDKLIVPCVLAGEFPTMKRSYHYNVTDSDVCNILCVSSIQRRKNQCSLISAVNKLRHKYKKIKLILVGIILDVDYHNEIKNLIVNNSDVVHYLSISDEELQNLYQSCNFTVYPSVEEGYGLPIAESMWHCRPCICMNYGSMDEIATAGCVKIDCNNIDQLSASIETLITDEKTLSSLLEEIKKVNIKTWKQYCDEIITCLKSI